MYLPLEIMEYLDLTSSSSFSCFSLKNFYRSPFDIVLLDYLVILEYQLCLPEMYEFRSYWLALSFAFCNNDFERPRLKPSWLFNPSFTDSSNSWLNRSRLGFLTIVFPIQRILPCFVALDMYQRAQASQESNLLLPLIMQSLRSFSQLKQEPLVRLKSC